MKHMVPICSYEWTALCWTKDAKWILIELLEEWQRGWNNLETFVGFKYKQYYNILFSSSHLPTLSCSVWYLASMARMIMAKVGDQAGLTVGSHFPQVLWSPAQRWYRQSSHVQLFAVSALARTGRTCWDQLPFILDAWFRQVTTFWHVSQWVRE